MLDAEKALKFGFGGKLAIHPVQAEIILSAYAPKVDEIVFALRVLAATEDSAVAQLDGKMVDGPVIRAAQNLIARAQPEIVEDAKIQLAAKGKFQA